MSCSSSSSRLRGGLYGCRIGPAAEADGDAVPPIDDVDQQGELHLFFFREVRFQRVVSVVERVAFGETCERLGPAERRAFAIRIARRFAPGRQQVDALFGFAAVARE